MREIEDVIRQLKDICSRSTPTIATLIESEIKKLERISVIQKEKEFDNMLQCSDCRPGRPCYGHGHY